MSTNPFEPPNENALRNKQAVWCLLVLALIPAYFATGSLGVLGIGIAVITILAPYLGVKSD